MAIMDFVKKRKEKPAVDKVAPVTAEPVVLADMKDADDLKRADDSDRIPEASSTYQTGVQHIEAMTTVWKRRDLIAAYVIIWFIYFCTSIQEVVVRALNPFVSSSFKVHSLTPVVGIMSSLFGGLSKLVTAKILDTWGRPQGLFLNMLLWIVGFVMMAACNDFDTYVAAQIFSLIGAQGVSYCMTVFISDTSSLLNRPLMLTFATSPFIVTTWIGGPMSDAIISGPGWRWGFGVWAIVIPFVTMPLVFLFLHNTRKAMKMGIITPYKVNYGLKPTIEWCKEVDLFGILLLAAGMSLFLLPMSIYSLQPEGWASPKIIGMCVTGFVLIILFVIWEKFGAPVTFIPFHLLSDRTVFTAGLMFVFVFFNSAVWGSYFTSMLMVVWNTGVTKATYISNIYRVGSCFIAIPFAYLMRRTGRFKWVNLYYALPLMTLGVGLLIKYRQPDSPMGLIVMTQIFIAFAGGPIVVAGEMAMMAPSDHQHIAVIIAILDLFGSTGTAIGSTVATAIWTGTFKKNLTKYMARKVDVESAYSSMYSQLGFPPKSIERYQISLAYGDSQRLMLITSVAALAGAWICVLMWRDIKVTGIKQTRGNVV